MLANSPWGYSSHVVPARFFLPRPSVRFQPRPPWSLDSRVRNPATLSMLEPRLPRIQALRDFAQLWVEGSSPTYFQRSIGAELVVCWGLPGSRSTVQTAQLSYTCTSPSAELRWDPPGRSRELRQPGLAISHPRSFT